MTSSESLLIKEEKQEDLLLQENEYLRLMVPWIHMCRELSEVVNLSAGAQLELGPEFPDLNEVQGEFEALNESCDFCMFPVVYEGSTLDGGVDDGGEEGADQSSSLDEDMVSVRNGNLYWAAFAALLASLSCGFAMGYSSPAIADLKVVMFRRLKMKQLDAAWFGSILAIGAIIGVLLCMWLINLIGRKLTLVLSSLPLIFGNTVIIASPSVWVLCFGRLLTGVATGLASLVVPIYLTEISHRRKKRILISCIPMMVTMGVFGVYSAGMVFAWRWLALCCCASSFMMLLAMVVMPETPRFLLQQKRRSDALAALTFLRGPDADHEWELKQIEDSIRIRGDKFHMKDLMDPTIYKPLYICSLLMLFQQLTGMYAIIFYAEIMIEEANFQDSGLAAVVVGAILFVFTVVFISIVDKTGRKVLLIVSGVSFAASG
ncbi:solute carrier family 2, facilitated glucose transporter member 8-like [Pleurodeles waltl]|uniref:solute carrier family 2, facilitated glucose transporter member 8-like n=1 Tax=Pleurodeles waltl TaxID=8319 RepID=UPI003709BCBD